ncbi:MAG TPA: Xaa-Pro peptidase family protein [Anaerolineae bacterium]|nr:Xaa-Pro peptidase family protein [Anaerolineae bacterium]HPL29239.1 Xaa-Pro peptidase family protein [Anaerolineae bacterium]
MKDISYFRYSWRFDDRKQFLELPFPMSEYERRVSNVKARMAESKLDALMILGDVRERGNIRYLTNFYAQLGHSAVILPLDGDPILATSAAAHGEPLHSFVYETWVRDIRGALYRAFPPNPPTVLQRVKEILDETKLRRARIGIVGWQLLGYDFFVNLKQAFPEVEWVEWLRPYELLKAVKSPLEVRVFEHAGAALDTAFAAALAVAKPGATELEVAGALEHEMRRGGVETVSYLFDTRVCSGPRAALKNGNPTARKLQRGDLLFIDISATYHGYALDCATSTVVDAEPTQEQLALLEPAAQMTEALVAASREGTPACELVEVARAVATKNGQGKNFIEFLVGHGLGCSQVEAPHCHLNSDDVLASGMIYAVEPMIVDPVLGTGTVERICCCGKDGGRLLTRLPLRVWDVRW